MAETVNKADETVSQQVNNSNSNQCQENSDTEQAGKPEITSAAPSNNILSNNNNNSASSVDYERRYRPQKYCAVCGDKAIACNFNAVTCESCKAFFRRNAFKEQRLKCLFENRCIIDRVTRRFCSKCRLLKCFHIGMKREWILTDEQKQIKRVKIMQNKQSRQQAPSSPSHSDSSSSPAPKAVERLNAGSIDHNNYSNRSQASSNRSKSKVVVPRGLASKALVQQHKVNTRDAATCCATDQESLSSSRAIHFCSLEAQCQFCSMRISGQVNGQAAIEYHQQQGQPPLPLNHQHLRMTYSQPNNGLTHQLVLAGSYSELDVSGIPQSRVGAASRPSSCCSLNSTSIQQAQYNSNSSQFVGALPTHQTGHQMSTINGLSHQLPQLHEMTPHISQVSDCMSANLVGSHYGQSVIVTASHNISNSSPVGAQSSHLTGSCFLPGAASYTPLIQTGSRGTKSFMVATDIHSGAIYNQNPPNTTDKAAEICKSDKTEISKRDDGIMRSVIQADSSESVDHTASTMLSMDKSCYVLWNNESYCEPAHTEFDLTTRLNKLDFYENERHLINESIEATKFMFEALNKEQRTQNPLNDIVHICDAALRRLIKTVKQIKAFRMLTMDDQIVLLKTACFKILLLRSTFHYQDECDGWVDPLTGKVMRLDILKQARNSLVYERHKELIRKLPLPLRKDRLIMAIMSLSLLFNPTVDLRHPNSVDLDNLIYLSVLRKYILLTQPDPLTKYESLVAALKVTNACNEEYNVFFSKDFQPEQITPLLIEIFDISVSHPA